MNNKNIKLINYLFKITFYLYIYLFYKNANFYSYNLNQFKKRLTKFKFYIFFIIKLKNHNKYLFYSKNVQIVEKKLL